MKIVTSKEMAQIEGVAYENGYKESDFMEQAGKGVATVTHEWVEQHNRAKNVVLLCGKGNNAGDAYVAGVYLLRLGYQVNAYHIPPIDVCSNLCQKNYGRFIAEGGQASHVQTANEIEYPNDGIIIDALFGTGFHGVAREPYASIISSANDSRLPIIALDIPSGLNGATGVIEGNAIQATVTTYLGLPKIGFFLADGWNYVGKLRYVDFGLPIEPIDAFQSHFVLSTHDQMKKLLPPMVRNRHKYSAGYVVGLTGAPGMPGAGILSMFSALRGGAGIVRLMHPKGMEAEFAGCPYELVKQGYDYDDVDTIVAAMNRASATLIGPAIGLGEKPRKLLKALLPQLKQPMVIDADALTIIAEENLSPPHHAILTPHVGEMRRLLHDTEHLPLSMPFLEQCQKYVDDKNIILVLKGGPSFIFSPDEPIVINPTGDPGMATAGSGDVLTGLLAALLAQGLSPKDAAVFGVYFHALAGESAAEEVASYSMVATDLIRYFPDTFKKLF